MELNERMLGELLTEGIREAVRKTPTLPWRTGTVMSADYFNRRAYVVIDGDDYQTPVQTGSPDLDTGARCWVVFTEHGGAVAFGPMGWSPWRYYEPVISQSGAVAYTVVSSRYRRDRDMVDAEFEAIITGTGVAGASIAIDLPVPADRTDVLAFIGWGTIYDAGGGTGLLCNGRARAVSFSAIDFLGYNGSPAPIGVAPNLQLSPGDRVQYTVRYHRGV